MTLYAAAAHYSLAGPVLFSICPVDKMHLVSVRPVALLGNSKQLCSLVSAYYPCLLLASTRWIIRDVATMIIQLADLVLSDIITCSAKCNVHGRLPVMKRLLMLHFWNSFSLAVIFFFKLICSFADLLQQPHPFVTCVRLVGVKAEFVPKFWVFKVWTFEQGMWWS